jgi:hypothetical protein
MFVKPCGMIHPGKGQKGLFDPTSQVET